jgi:hypothetical protein
MGLWIKNADGTIERTAGGGADGQPGVDGEDGQPGADGNMWHVGSGAPASTLGEPGDYYLDGTDGWVHVKRNDSSWTNLYVNLTGPPGSGGGGDFLPLTGGEINGTLNINHKGKQAEPSLSFNTGSNGIMGFYSAYDDRLRVTVGGIAQADFHDELFETLYDARVRGDLQVDGAASVGNGKILTFNGNWENCRIYNTGSSGREYMVIGNGTAGAQINLYGINDATGAGNILFYAGEAEGGGSRTVGRWDGPTGSFVAYRDAEVRGNLQVNGQIKAQNGTQKAPAYSFANETNTGIWYDSVGVEIVKEGTRVAKLLKTATFLPGVNATVMGSSYKANVMSMWNGQLVLIDGLNRSNIKETEAVSHAATNNVYDLQPVWFRSTSNTDNPEHSYYGLIADDCAAIDPRLATYRADKDGVEVADDVNTDAVVALLVSAVKSQRDTIADLTARIETLEGQTRL